MSRIPLTSEHLAAHPVTADVRDELVIIGFGESGHQVHGGRYYVTLTDDLGHRWRHFLSFCTSEVQREFSKHDGFLEIRHINNERSDAARAQKLADAVNAHLAAGGTLNLDFWSPTDTAYGSPAWTFDDEAELAMFD